MKHNLKNRPKDWWKIDYEGSGGRQIYKWEKWARAFEAELREMKEHLEKQDQAHLIPLRFITLRMKEILGDE